jgi:hypothetical protein
VHFPLSGEYLYRFLRSITWRLDATAAFYNSVLDANLRKSARVGRGMGLHEICGRNPQTFDPDLQTIMVVKTTVCLLFHKLAVLY